MKIDFGKLFGFDLMSREFGASSGSDGALDFQSDAMASRLGAKASVESRPIKQPANDPADHASDWRGSRGTAIPPVLKDA